MKKHNPKDEHIRVYVTPETKKQIQKQAEQEGINTSPWLRRLAKKELEKKAPKVEA